ncbi:alpha-D-ribose 1-methylphosphonate 5-triphosphate diphosphatase [Bordetella sp. 02P26C-1]|uniref:alpha-D-ribose 1-methylphosphonate 5-triphosphate diphosphatase n=1 Tax=Bordetella sp. 02P26C-1 TaxID=2683195 RepID=UPI00135338B1|nr:alpha-D-ribose 1-methylphosphonate 5-triphosphate diphosphatase [Bordetella sp. 02P26C-1]MVW79594.1 alpha-D-ribose 1-methylphosphonate 5-triphosphate diphosphatase [Bordetella sp. 02P26C-1]
MSSLYLTHARIVLPDSVLEDSALLIEDGFIKAIEPQTVRGATMLDMRGQTLLPGLIDVHCDAIEKEAEPRSKVLFPLDFAVAQVDRRNAAAGIMTPYHALSFSNSEWGVRNNETAARVVRAIRAFRGQGLVDNRVHCRYEITDAAALPVLERLLEEGAVDLLSVMDHSPGQGQFKSLESYVQYMMGNHAYSRDEAEQVAREKLQSRDGAAERVKVLLAHAQGRGVPTASHDDDTVQRVVAMRSLGVSMSEFPINLDTAKAAVSCGLPTVLGAPNILRGQSQSGSMRAIDAVRAGVAGILCSDYQPSTLIAAAFLVAAHTDLTLPQAVALVTANPADACRLNDRGRVAVGLRADLVAVTLLRDLPMVTHAWSAGRLVFSSHYRVPVRQMAPELVPA